uniref:Succinate dehydrogenase assembly factor 4, mitochondrial n=1 Tax=Panagrolaimus sp. JU765 TaxID=591449 RepID=A0AC34RDG2_9BILA
MNSCENLQHSSFCLNVSLVGYHWLCFHLVFFMDIFESSMYRRFLVSCHARFVSTTTKKIPPKKGRTPVGEFDDPKIEENEKRRIVNPETGEIGGPQGPEPTRYGDWERK